MKINALVIEDRNTQRWTWEIQFDHYTVVRSSGDFDSDGDARRYVEQFFKSVWRMNGFPIIHRIPVIRWVKP